MGRIGRFIECLFEEHKLVRRAMVLWAICLITWTVFKVFEDVSQINAAVTAALGTVTALLTAGLGFYQWSRQNEDKK